MIAQQHIEPEKPDGFVLMPAAPPGEDGRKKSIIELKKHYQQ